MAFVMEENQNMIPKYVPEEFLTFKGRSCSEDDDTSRIPVQPFGSVGKVHHIYGTGRYNDSHRDYEGPYKDFIADAVVLSDSGSCCGGGDDIKVCVRQSPNINDWETMWIDANEFFPIAIYEQVVAREFAEFPY